MSQFTDLEVQMFINDTICFKNSLNEFRSVLFFVQILQCCCLTIQLVMLPVFNIKVKNLAFDTSNIITNARFSMKN